MSAPMMSPVSALGAAAISRHSVCSCPLRRTQRPATAATLDSSRMPVTSPIGPDDRDTPNEPPRVKARPASGRGMLPCTALA